MKIMRFLTLILSIIIISCNSENSLKTIEGTGTLETENIILSSQVGGEVIEINADEGEKVMSGDTLLIVDPEIYKLQLEQAEAAKKVAEAQLKLLKTGAREEEREQATAMLKQAQVNYESAKADKERFENLYTEHAVTKKQLEDIISRFEIAEAQLKTAKENKKKIENIARPEEIEQAEANLKRAEANEALLQKNLDNCYITSPISGQIIEKFIDPGEVASPMSALFKIADLSIAEITVYVPENKLGLVKLNQSAEITVDTFPDIVYEGKVVYISPEAEFTPKNIQTKDERTKLVFGVKIKIPNPEYELKHGMPADVVIKLQD